MPKDPSQHRLRWYRSPWLLLVAVPLMFLFFCSGLHSPVWRPKARLDGHLSRVPGLALPASARVTHAVGVATRDPAEYYRVEMPPADVGAFMAKVRSASSHGEEDDPRRPWTMGDAPEWWKPLELPDVKRLDIFHAAADDDFTFYYSQPAGILYVFWFSP